MSDQNRQKSKEWVRAIAISLTVFCLLIYLLALAVNKKSASFFVAFAICELATFAGFFAYLQPEFAGVIQHLLWGSVFSIAAVYFAKAGDIVKQEKTTTIAVIAMILFQLIMAADSLINPFYESFLYNSYKFICLLIHCAICISFINWSIFKQGLVSKFNNYVGFFRATITSKFN